jgi:cation transport ATPase
LLLALATLAVACAAGVAPDEALLRALTVLVITCPCAIGIATPLAKVAVMSACSARGIVVRRPEALDRLPEVDTIVFDKTGTLTEGRFALRRVIPCGGVEAVELLQRAASVERPSAHFLARPILAGAEELGLPLPDIDGFQATAGQGVRAIVGGVETAVGNRRHMRAGGWDVPLDLERQAMKLETDGLTVIFCGWGGRVRGVLGLGDAVKPGSVALVARLQSRGLAVRMLSGDSERTTRAVAQALGIADARGGIASVAKAEIVRALGRQGLRVVMVGDGVNDAAALVEADVGIAMGTGSDLLRDVSGITILGPRPEKLLDLLGIAGIARRVSRGNLRFAMAYNLLALPLAIAGRLNPVVAAVAMFCSSLTVIGNTLRILRQASDPDRAAYSASIGKVMEAPNQPMIVTRTESARTSRM